MHWHWLRSVFGSILGYFDDARAPIADQRAFARREAELQERLRRLERLAVEADVIQRADSAEEPRP